MVITRFCEQNKPGFIAKVWALKVTQQFGIAGIIAYKPVACKTKTRIIIIVFESYNNLKNSVTKSSYAKWRQTTNHWHRFFYRNDSFELLTRLHGTLNFTLSY